LTRLKGLDNQTKGEVVVRDYIFYMWPKIWERNSKITKLQRDNFCNRWGLILF